MTEILGRGFSIFLFNFSTMFSLIAIYWLFGMLLGSLVSVFGKNKLHSFLAAMRDKELGLFGLIPASLVGIASPICMYGTLPISASFAKKGVPDDWLAAFMVSSILLNPQLLWYTSVLGRGAVVVRFLMGFLCGIAAGLLVHFFFTKKGKSFFNFKSFNEAENRDTHPNTFIRFLKNLLRNLKATGPAFLIGVTLAALFESFVPASNMAALFGRHQLFGYLMAFSIGVPFFFCGGATIPLLMMWLASGMSFGTAVIFMITGQAMKIINLGALKVVLGVKHFLFYILFIVVFSLLSGIMVDFFPTNIFF